MSNHSLRKILLLTALFIYSPVGFNQPVDAGKPTGPLAGFGNSRSWADQTGSFTVTAKMVEANSKTVKLEKSDGRVVSVPVEKLGESSKSFVQAFLAAEAAMPGSDQPDNPFAGGVMSADSNTAAGDVTAPPSVTATATTSLDDTPMREMSDRLSESISIDFGKPFWEAGPVSPMKLPSLPNRSINLPMAKEFFAGVNMKIAGASPVALLSVYRHDRSGKENYTRLGRYEFESRTPVALGQAGQPWKILAVSNDGSLMAVVRIEGFDKGNDVAICKLTDSAATPIYQFTAGSGSFGEVRWGGFLSKDRLATVDQKHKLVVWDLRNGRIIQTGSVGNKTMTAEIGGNGELLAIPTAGAVAVLDGESLRQVGTIALETTIKPSIAFSPNGKWFATYTPFAVAVYSLEDGKKIKQIAVPNAQPELPLDWIGDNLLLDYSLLIDVERERPWWNYDSGRGPRVVYGDTLFTLFPDKQQSSLVVSQLPHAAAQRSIASTDDLQLFALNRGADIAISMNLSGIDGGMQQRIRGAIEQKIRANGWNIAANSSNKIELQLQRGKPESQEYVESRGFGPPVPFGPRGSGPTTKVNVRPWLHKVVVTVGGQEVYSTQRTVGAPGYLPNEKGKSTQQQVNERLKPSPEFFESVKLPARLYKPEYRGGFGKSRITPSGIQ